MLAAMKRARGSDSIVDRPADLQQTEICALSGLRPSPWCPAIEREWVSRDAPVEFCSWHHSQSVTLPPEMSSGAPAPSPALVRLRVTSPPNGATYLIDPTLRSEYQALPLSAVSNSRVRWHVDGRPVKEREWSLVVGRHTVTAVDAAGNRDEVTIRVK
jgi:membrane carboxypeptidase/penicillin-binding protein PbpC